MPDIKRLNIKKLGPFLEGIYRKYNRRRFVHPDPLEFLYLYNDPRDREIAGLVASGLACGRVEQILASVSLVLSRMKNPADFAREENENSMRKIFKNFRHRFADGDNLAAMLAGAGVVSKKHGSLGSAYKKYLDSLKDPALALGAFVDEFRASAKATPGTSFLVLKRRARVSASIYISGGWSGKMRSTRGDGKV